MRQAAAGYCDSPPVKFALTCGGFQSKKHNNVAMTKITNHRVMFFKVKHYQLFTERSSVNSHWCLSFKCLNVVKVQSRRRQPCLSLFPASGDRVCSRL